MADLSTITKEAVLAAISEFDLIGRDRFLSKYGYRPANAVFVRHNGELYDQRAIIGVAYAKQHRQPGPPEPQSFRGGTRTGIALLEPMGFEIVRVKAEPTSVFADHTLAPGNKADPVPSEPGDPRTSALSNSLQNRTESATATGNAAIFAELLRTFVPRVPEYVNRLRAAGNRRRERGRRRTPCDFVELDLQECIEEGAPTLPCTILVNTPCDRTGKIDYQIVDHVRVIATCELKGPARPKLRRNTENIWFWAIVKDVAKQFYRCHSEALRTTEHYVAVLLHGPVESVRVGFDSECLGPLRLIFPTASITAVTYVSTVAGAEPTTIAVFQVARQI